MLLSARNECVMKLQGDTYQDLCPQGNFRTQADYHFESAVVRLAEFLAIVAEFGEKLGEFAFACK